MKRLLLIPLSLWLGGCTTTQILSSGEMASLGPTLSVERFLQAINERDLHSMASLFGTADGPMIDTGSPVGCAFKKIGSWIGIGSRCRTLAEVEIRMDAVSQILRHEDYTIGTESSVAGRAHPTTRIGVNLRINGRDFPDVPFLVVMAGDGRWLVEEIGLGRVTG